MPATSRRSLAPRALLVAALFSAFALSPALARDPVVEAVRLALQKADAAPAVAAGERAVAARPKDADAWFYAGQAFGKMAMQASLVRKAGWAGKTREAFQQAVTLDPDHLGARQGLVQFYTMAPAIMGGGKDKAAAEIASFAARNAAGGHYLRASGLEGAQAERELRAAVRLAPDETRYRAALATHLERGKRSAEALAAIDAGLARSPGDARLLYLLGRHAAVHGQRADEGLAALDRLLANTARLPDDVPAAGAHWRRGQLREKRGDASQALADYRRAAALAPGLKDVKQDIARLGGTP